VHPARAALLALITAGCAVALPGLAPSASEDVAAVYRAILASPEFREFARAWLLDERPWIDEQLIVDLAGFEDRWDIDHFEPWLQLSRLPAVPGPAGQTLVLPDGLLDEFPGRGFAGVRLSRVGFDEDRERACVAFRAGRSGLFYLGGTLDLDLVDGAWRLTPVEPHWVLSR
jgi:hypothetical protein